MGTGEPDPTVTNDRQPRKEAPRGADHPMNIKTRVSAAFAAAPLWYVATCQGNDPNVVPVGCKWVEQDRLLIADLFFSHTRANLALNPRVAVSVGLLDPKRGFQVKATARVHRDGPVFERVCALLKAAGMDARPWGAIEIPFDEVYSLDPGPEAGARIVM